MDVKFITTTSSRLSELPIVSGQLIYLSDVIATYYDMGGARNFISSVRLVHSLPEGGGQSNTLYCIVNDSGCIDAYMWDADGTRYRQVSGYAATTDRLGLVKPDGTTITIDSSGTISCHAPVDTLPASAITYDNTTSHLAATNVQAGLDEVNSIAKGAVASASSAISAADAASQAAADASSAAASATSIATSASAAATAAQTAAAGATTAAAAATETADNALTTAASATSLATDAQSTADAASAVAASATSLATEASQAAASATSLASAAQAAAASATSIASDAATQAEQAAAQAAAASTAIAAYESRIAALEQLANSVLLVEDNNLN